MSGIFNMFGPSPIRPLEQHMHKVHSCAKQLLPLVKAAILGDWPSAQQHYQAVRDLENEADSLKRDLRLHLPSGLFLPVARTDLLSLLHHQDKIANLAKDIAGLVCGRMMSFPRVLKEKFPPFVKLCIEASRQACKAINELDELLESGFRGNEVKIVEKMIMHLDDLEKQSDQQLADIRHCIFELEDALPPVQVIFLYKLVDWTGQLADCAQTVGGRLQILIAR